jgi:hypothetical protein
MTLFITGNYPTPTTAPPTAVSTTTSTRTMLQVAPPSTRPISVVKWGINFSAAPTAAVTCELFSTSVAASVGTAAVAAGVTPYDRTTGTPVSTVQLGAALTGYTFTTENTVASYRQGDLQIIPSGASQFTWEWSLGREFEVGPSSFLRLRMTTTAAANVLCWVLWDE